MNLSQITAFRAVMNSATLSEAAEKLGRTQPAVSLAIRALEDTLGLKLFERRGRQLIPVPEAQYLLAETSEILDRLTAVSATMKSLINGQSGSLNIAAMPGPSTYLFPRFISRAIGDNPNIRITLSSRTSMQIRELAATQAFDFGFADLVSPGAASPTFHQEIIAGDCYCALPRDHPLAVREVIEWSDLDGLPLGSLQATHVMHTRTVQALEQAGFHANIVLDSQYFLPLMQFISAGRCLSVVDPLTMVTELEMNSTDGRVVFRPLFEAFRYSYVTLSPIYRPLSQLARQVKDGWQNEVMELLTGVDARPVLEVGP